MPDIRPPLLLVALLTLSAPATPVAAQYMYLDGNGDGISTAADTLHASGPTVLTIYLDTSHDRDGSVRSCNAHTGAPTSGFPLDLFSYTITLTAVGGTVTWGAFTPAIAGYGNLGSPAASTTQIEINFGRTFGTNQAGLVALGAIPLTVTSGSPHVEISQGTQPVDPSGFGTGFGTDCESSQYEHTYVLGIDWFDTDGVGPSSGGDTAIPTSLTAQRGVLYLGGHRFTAPMTLSRSGETLAVNGMTIPPDSARTFPRSTPTSIDTLRDLLDRTAVATARDGISRGLSRVDVLNGLRDLYAASSIVRSVTADSTGLWVAYVDKMGTPNRKAFPPDLLLRSSTPQETAHSTAVHVYEWLRAFQQHLDDGGLLIYLRHRVIYIPTGAAGFVDRMLQKLLAGQSLSTAEVNKLKAILPPERWQEASRLLPLVLTK